MIPGVSVTRYVTPLREGGSLPGVVEGDDLGTYVCKCRGAGQGVRVLVAEVVVGELARRIGLRTPDLVALELDPEIARYEADEEVQDLLNASAGLNLGVDFLPGAFGFDGSLPQGAATGPSEVAARVLWLDAFTANVDRSWRNPNLLMWHGDLWLIDHGATMIWHHNWPGADASAARSYDASDHALARFRPDLAGAAAELAPRVTEELLAEVTAQVPDAWLAGEPGFGTPDDLRRAYARPLLARAAAVHERVTGIEEGK